MGSWIEYVDPEWHGMHMNLSIDNAYLRIGSSANETRWLYELSEECYLCPHTRTKKIPAGKSTLTTLDVSHSISLKILDEDVGKYAFENKTAVCTFTPEMGEFGVYKLLIHNNNTCNFSSEKNPVNIYLPFLVVTFIFVTIILLLRGSLILWNKYRFQSDRERPVEIQNSTEKKRLKSLDAFRGMSIVLMIFVNSGGGKYWWIEHATWNGLHVADIVFPSFLWIMGVCIPISVRSQLNKGIPKNKICSKILQRSLKLFFIGLCLNSMSGPKLENLRIMGVLQRFGIAYFICATLHTICSKIQLTPAQGKVLYIYDFFILKIELLFSILLIITNLSIIFSINIPDCPRGYLGPGGKHSMAKYSNCIGGSIGYIDKIILGERHIYQHPTAKHVYDSNPFDPEGIIGCLLTVVHVLLGVHCGVIIITYAEWKSRIVRWILWTVTLGLIGGILCWFSKEDGWIPINKNLWSLSYVLTTSSIAYFLLSLCYYFIDVRSVWSGYPFVEAGMNAIIMYIGHSIFHKMLPWHWNIGDMNTHFLNLLEASWNTMIWVLISLYLYKKRIFYNL